MYWPRPESGGRLSFLCCSVCGRGRRSSLPVPSQAVCGRPRFIDVSGGRELAVLIFGQIFTRFKVNK